jgi:putative ABC transport system permease protein
VAAAVDDATGTTDTVTRQQAADAVLDIGGGVLTIIIGLTVAIAVAVVALFFALLTLERAPLFGVLKAVGARTGTLFAGTAAQAATLAAGAGLVATIAGLTADRVLPAGSIPFQLSAGRAALSVAQLLVAALVGAALCLRRIARTDPAATIGRTQ